MEKDERLGFRISGIDKTIIRAYAKNHNLSIADYMIRCSLQRKIPSPLTSEELETWTDLKKMATDLNRLGNLFRNKDPELHQETRKVVHKLNKEMDKINRNGK